MATRKLVPEHFECEAAYTPAVYNQQGGLQTFSGSDVRQKLAANNIAISTDLPDVLVPVGLRWRVKPTIGLPFTPFNVWRKGKKSSLPFTPVASYPFYQGQYFLNGPFYRVLLVMNNNGPIGATYTITPLDAKYTDYGAKNTIVSISAGGTVNVQIDQPNTGGVKITGGSFSISSATGISMQAYLNDPDWKLLQVVGLPFKPGTIDPALYAPDQQGFAASLTDPETACKQRTDLYALFYKAPQNIASDGTAIPVWNTPSGSDLLNAYNKTAKVKNGKTGVLNDIKEMLVKVYQTSSAAYVGMQKKYLKVIKSKGVLDPANTNPQDNGTYRNPVCSTMLLSACTDCWNALGLGFGTMDFLAYANVITGSAILKGDLYAFDYMITAQFRMPLVDNIYQFPFTIKEQLTGFEEVEYAALCHFDLQKPPMPDQLLAENVSQNRPLMRDDNYYENVRVSWAKPAVEDKSPLCYAMAFKNNLNGGTVKFLNDDRPFIPGKQQPYTPAIRNDADAEDLPGREGMGFERYYHDRSPVPFIGSVTEQYYVASQNVFGLWSNWAIANDILIARPPQVPRIVSAAFTANSDGINSHIYNGSKLEIVINYDWEDRTPFEIQVAGYFVSPPVPNPPVTVSGLVKSNSGGAMEKYVIRFSGSTPKLGKLDAGNNFVAVAASEGLVKTDGTPTSGSGNGLPSNSNTDMRTYRVTLKQITLNFTAQTRLWFTLYTRASEVKNPALFSTYSNIDPVTALVDPVKVNIINISDPVPRNPPSFPPDIKWASLPDATNTSRYHLKFSGVTGAAGYAVYRATEMSLRDRMKEMVSYPATGTLFQRRDALNSASANDKVSALDAFIRINKKMLTATELELEMNGDTGGLFIYAVSSFTDQNVESKLSSWTFVAVPERITPAPPRLTGFVNKKLVVPKAILKVDLGAGNNTATVEIFRTSKRYLGADLNLMGLPVKTGPAVGWSKYKIVDGVNDTLVVDPAASFDYYRIEEDAPEGWAPLYYRAVGLGLNQPTNGKMPGRSPSSNLLELLPPTPAAPPDIINATLIANAPLTQLRLSFKSNAFVGRSPYGMHTLFVYQQNADGLWDELKGGNIPEMKKLDVGDAEPLNELVRLQSDGAGHYSYALNIAIAKQISLKIVVADPLGKNTAVIVGYRKPGSKVVISGIVIKKLATVVNVAFKTSVGKTQPLIGQYTLNMYLKKGLISKLILSTAMHNIPNILLIIGNAAIAGGTAQDANRLYSYRAAFRGAANLTDFASATSLVIEIFDPKGVRTFQEVPV